MSVTNHRPGPGHRPRHRHQLRPLFGFLNALTLPTTIYAVESDFDAYRLSSDELVERIARAAEKAVAQLGRGNATLTRHPAQAAA